MPKMSWNVGLTRIVELRPGSAFSGSTSVEFVRENNMWFSLPSCIAVLEGHALTHRCPVVNMFHMCPEPAAGRVLFVGYASVEASGVGPASGSGRTRGASAEQFTRTQASCDSYPGLLNPCHSCRAGSGFRSRLGGAADIRNIELHPGQG